MSNNANDKNTSKSKDDKQPMTLEEILKKRKGQMPGLDNLLIPDFGDNSWGGMIDGFIKEVLHAATVPLLDQIKQQKELIEELISKPAKFQEDAVQASRECLELKNQIKQKDAEIERLNNEYDQLKKIVEEGYKEMLNGEVPF